MFLWNSVTGACGWLWEPQRSVSCLPCFCLSASSLGIFCHYHGDAFREFNGVKEASPLCTTLPYPQSGHRVLFFELLQFLTTRTSKIVSVICGIRTLIRIYWEENPHQFQIAVYFSILCVGYIFIVLYDMAIEAVEHTQPSIVLIDIYLVLWRLFSRALIT